MGISATERADEGPQGKHLCTAAAAIAHQSAQACDNSWRVRAARRLKGAHMHRIIDGLENGMQALPEEVAIAGA